MIILTPNDEGLPDGNLLGAFYIGILGTSSSVYTLNYHTTKVSNEVDGNVTYKDPILLNQDKATRGVLLNSSDY